VKLTESFLAEQNQLYGSRHKYCVWFHNPDVAFQLY